VDAFSPVRVALVAPAVAEVLVLPTPLISWASIWYDVALAPLGAT